MRPCFAAAAPGAMSPLLGEARLISAMSAIGEDARSRARKSRGGGALRTFSCSSGNGSADFAARTSISRCATMRSRIVGSVTWRVLLGEADVLVEHFARAAGGDGIARDAGADKKIGGGAGNHEGGAGAHQDEVGDWPFGAIDDGLKDAGVFE